MAEIEEYRGSNGASQTPVFDMGNAANRPLKYLRTGCRVPLWTMVSQERGGGRSRPPSFIWRALASLAVTAAIRGGAGDAGRLRRPRALEPCDMRHATCDMRHATCDMRHAQELQRTSRPRPQPLGTRSPQRSRLPFHQQGHIRILYFDGTEYWVVFYQVRSGLGVC